ncbi:unnamed protein product [Linum tenue]|uniref:Uncharacterized protein n=1 Tax=Linum tenue TaxID=586396 RepID=A0AAV0GMY4_9ROSI|nr:unnamed protein product [Linum tenue]
MASRYNSYDSTRSSASSFTSSAEFNPSSITPTSSSRALVKSKPSDLSQLKSNPNKSKPNGTHNLTAMVKKFMEKKTTFVSSSNKKKAIGGLVIPADLIAEDLKKNTPAARRGAAGLVGLQKKLFGKEKGSNKKEVKALTEVKGNGYAGNTRTLAMVLRSERELLSANKDMEEEIGQLKSMLETRNREVDKLKDLCLKQREEIKSLKNAVLFPDLSNSQLQDLLEQQGSELKQAKTLIPNLQRQVTSLTGQLQCLAEGLAEVKAEKYGRPRWSSSPRTPTFNCEGSANSLDFSSCGVTTPGSPDDDMFVKDLNPCLTPYVAKTNSKEFDEVGYDCSSSYEEQLPETTMHVSDEPTFSSNLRKLSRSSDRYKSPNVAAVAVRAARRSDESKPRYGKQQLHHRAF